MVGAPMLIVAGIAFYLLYQSGALRNVGIGTGSTQTQNQQAQISQAQAAGGLLGGLLKGLTSTSTVAKTATSATGNPSNTGAIGSAPVVYTSNDLTGLQYGTTPNTIVPGTGQSVGQLQNLGYSNDQIRTMQDTPMSSLQTTGDLSSSVDSPTLTSVDLGQSSIGTSQMPNLGADNIDLPTLSPDSSADVASITMSDELDDSSWA